MRKSFLTKAVVAVGVMVSAMALSSTAVFAGTIVDNQNGTVTDKHLFYITGDGNANYGDNDSSFFKVEKSFQDGGPKSYTDPYGTLHEEVTKALKMDSTGKVTFTTLGSAKVTVVWAAKTNSTDNCTMKIGDNVSSSITGTDGVKSFSATLTEPGEYVVTRGSKESRLYAVAVEDTYNNATKTYTLSGTQTGLSEGDEFTLTKGSVSFTATVGSDGSWSVTKNGEESPFTVDDSYTVTCEGYSVTGSVTITAGDSETEFNGGSISFTPLPLSALTKGTTYSSSTIAAGLPNFDISGVDWNDKTSCRPNTSSSIKFIAPCDTYLIINAKSASKDKDLNLTVGTKAVIVPDNVARNYVIPVTEGENTLYIGEGSKGSTSLYINSITLDDVSKSGNAISGNKDSTLKDTKDYYYSDGTNLYYVYTIKRNSTLKDLSDYDSFTVKVGETTPIETSTVYDKVKFSDGSSVTASSLNAEAIYAVKVTNATYIKSASYTKGLVLAAE